tara:strand:- start:150 stop:1040 length:891 start_codon:yes stop_codon:yes gene_type:complete
VPSSLNNYTLLVFLGAVWGASFVAIKYCSILFNPIEVGFFRTFIAAIFLLLIVSLRKGNYDFFGKNTFTYSIVGLFNAAIPFTLIPYGLLALPSNIGVIIMSANPFLALILAHFFTNDEKLNLRKSIGTIIGFSGVVFAVGVEVFVTDMDSLIGALAIYLAGCSYVVSNLIIRKISDQPSDMVTMNSLMWGSVWLLPLMFMYGNFSNYELSYLPISAIIYLGIIPTGLAFSLRQVLIRNTGSTFMMQVAYLIPIFGIFYGWLLLSEPLKLSLFVGLVLVIAGIAVSRMQIDVETKY